MLWHPFLRLVHDALVEGEVNNLRIPRREIYGLLLCGRLAAAGLRVNQAVPCAIGDEIKHGVLILARQEFALGLEWRVYNFDFVQDGEWRCGDLGMECCRRGIAGRNAVGYS